MSLTNDGKQIKCDGAGCDKMAHPPVGLRPLLSGGGGDRQTVAGWLFVNAQQGIRHYCPACAAAYISVGTDFQSNPGTTPSVGGISVRLVR
ncbi:MAG: hypothetical protein P4L33_20520 [Capsulimonadaceae bacterium]|nr:hypothetical protein [Capsulimonadaceae bacterium]